MIFTDPTPFVDAAEHSAVKTLLPSALNTQEAQEHLSAEIMERARWSSLVESAEWLDELDWEISKLAHGFTDLGSARKVLREKAQELDIQPKEGKEGTIQDIRTSRRLNLTITTNVQMAQGYGQYMQGQDPAVLDAFPAQELYRAQSRKVPRNWNARWAQAARATGAHVAGFVALKNALIWTALSRFGTPYPPYDYNSGMRTRGVLRSKAEGLGLIDRDTRIQPEDRQFNEDLTFTPQIRSQQLRQAIIEGSDGRLYFDQSGVLQVRPARAAANLRVYDPADESTWAGNDESTAFANYLHDLFTPDAEPLQEAA